jgi:hypothetical protein
MSMGNMRGEIMRGGMMSGGMMGRGCSEMMQSMNTVMTVGPTASGRSVPRRKRLPTNWPQ